MQYHLSPAYVLATAEPSASAKHTNIAFIILMSLYLQIRTQNVCFVVSGGCYIFNVRFEETSDECQIVLPMQ